MHIVGIIGYSGPQFEQWINWRTTTTVYANMGAGKMWTPERFVARFVRTAWHHTFRVDVSRHREAPHEAHGLDGVHAHKPEVAKVHPVRLRVLLLVHFADAGEVFIGDLIGEKYSTSTHTLSYHSNKIGRNKQNTSKYFA